MPKYKKISIWYFSGTGNARFAAHKIAETAGQKGVEVSVSNIADSDPDFPDIDDHCLIGFCFPTHGFNAPPIVVKFILKFPKGKSDVFLLNTRAGLKLFKIHLPGIGGLALWLPAIMLLLKGYRTIGFRPLDMPSNWISLHPGLTTNAVLFITRHCTQTLQSFTNKIITGKPVLNGLFWLPLDLSLIPISLGYYFFGRFALAKTFYASYRCTNCGLCIKDCPVRAIREKDGRPFWTFDCESCMKCMNHCPQRAIETAHGFSFLIWWLAFSVVPLYLIRLLFRYQILPEDIYYQYFNLIFNIIVFMTGLIVIFFGYEILHRLLGIRFFNKLITWTSLTHLKCWRRYLKK